MPEGGPIHLGEGQEVVAEVAAFRLRAVEHVEELGEIAAQVGAVGLGLAADADGEEVVAGEDTGVLGEVAEQEAAEEDVKLVGEDARLPAGCPS